MNGYYSEGKLIINRYGSYRELNNKRYRIRNIRNEWYRRGMKIKWALENKWVYTGVRARKRVNGHRSEGNMRNE